MFWEGVRLRHFSAPMGVKAFSASRSRILVNSSTRSVRSVIPYPPGFDKILCLIFLVSAGKSCFFPDCSHFLHDYSTPRFQCPEVVGKEVLPPSTCCTCSGDSSVKAIRGACSPTLDRLSVGKAFISWIRHPSGRR